MSAPQKPKPPKAKSATTTRPATQEKENAPPGNKYKLKIPIESDGKKITEVEIHPLKAKDAVAAEEELIARESKDLSEVGNLKRTVYMLARLIRLPVDDVLEMDTKDIQGLQDFLS